ncbi:MAG: TIGR00159 family protein [Clostridiales bacterium]|nr:TIGR00159 family protein [Clostridiales bacterium]
MNLILDALDSILSVIKLIDIRDILDIVFLSYLLYKGMKLVRETRAEQLVKGIALMFVSYFIVRQVGLRTMRFLFENFFQWGILAIIVMFQPELRRALEKMGRAKVSNLNVFSGSPDSYTNIVNKWNICIDAIVGATTHLSEGKVGALIVVERLTKLGEQIDTGTMVNASPSAAIFENIFFPNSPLHDGAVIVRDGEILAAGCYLPKPQKEELVSKEFGSRHRAAIGMSEQSDAIVVVVSEETGVISVADNGHLTRGFEESGLKVLLKSLIIPERSDQENGKKKGFFKRLFNR